MILHQWDIVRVRIRPDDKDEHPAVILSREEWCQDPRQLVINVLYCTTKRPAVEATALDVTLNGADGLDRATSVNCGHVFSVPRSRITAIIGRVALARRPQIGRTLVFAFRLPLHG
jgi:mRNA-degrading endonuclease toxin of MazEF toxin-antitoxin module